MTETHVNSYKRDKTASVALAVFFVLEEEVIYLSNMLKHHRGLRSRRAPLF